MSALTGCSAGPLPGGSVSAAAGGSSESANQLVSVPKDCPTGSTVSALAGFSVPDAKVTRQTGVLDCNYQGGSAAHAIEITFHASDSQTNAAALDKKIESVAASISGKTTVAELPGYGQSAFTMAGKADAGILVWNGGVYFDVIDNLELDGVERVARGVLAS
jgi:hypothetical protein